MPAWVLAFLWPMAKMFLINYAIPFLEKRFPALVPILEEIIHILGGGQASPQLLASADHYLELKKKN